MPIAKQFQDLAWELQYETSLEQESIAE